MELNYTNLTNARSYELHIIVIFLDFCILVGMVKQPAMEPSEFTMSHEDFPALPGVPASSAVAAMNSTAAIGQPTNTIGDTVRLISNIRLEGNRFMPAIKVN